MPPHLPDAGGRGYEVDEAHPAGTEPAEQPHRRHRAAAGGQHGVNEDHFALAQILGQTLVIKLRGQSFLLALQTDEADPGFWDELQDGIQHPQPRT